MALADWSRTDEADDGRAKRLAGSYAVAAGLVAAVLVVGVVFGGQIKKQVLDEEVNVKFVPPEPMKVAPPPPPPPAPPPAKVAVSTNRPKLGSVTDAPPTEIPKGPPAEGDPSKPKDEGPVGEGDPNGCVGCTGKAAPPAPKPVETAPPAPPAQPAPPLQVAEVSTPAMITSKTMPAYPEDARKQGIEAVIVVKLVIDEAGRLEDATIAKGHPLFDELVLTAIRTWTFQPATLDGRPVRMAKLVKIPFRLKST